MPALRRMAREEHRTLLQLMIHRSAASLLACCWMVAGCWQFSSDDVGYAPRKTIDDASTGLKVVMAEISTMSSWGYNVYVFNKDVDTTNFSTEWQPVIVTASMKSSEEPKFYYDGKCYILEADYRSGGLISPSWVDAHTGRTLCFDLRPDRGPKGGYKVP